jgi:LPXTG-site transpeptidase (sortase) family protein
MAGFTLGVVAVAGGFLFAGPAGVGPQSEAARVAEQVTAVRMAIDPSTRPSAEATSEAVSAEPIAFDDDPAALFSNQHATRLVVAAVGIDAEVRPVGLVYRSGKLEYDVPRLEAGQYTGTARPGDPGNVVIGGHVAQRGIHGVFEALPGVAAGDVVEVYRGDQVFRYSITEIRVVAADATDVMGHTQEATLTLITCFPDDGYRERLVVVGRLM